MEKRRLLRITTVPVSLHLLLKGQFRFMHQNGFEILTASAAGAEVEEVKKEGVNHVVIPFTRKITPVADLICILGLIKLIRRFRPEIVHTHTPKAGLLGMIAARLCGVPIRLHTVAGLPYTESKGLKKQLLRFTEYITYRCAMMVYPNSMHMQEFMIQEFGFDPKRLRVLGRGSTNGIDTNYFMRSPGLTVQAHSIRDRYSIADNDLVFIFVGRLVKDKGIMELVSAFDQLESGKHNRLLLVGPFEQDLDPLPDHVLRFLNTDPRVILAGFQNDVRPWIAASDIFVFPSYREGFPNVVMQASALELPVVATDINGCNELVIPDVTGLLVPVRDVARLKEAMESLSADREKRKTLGMNGRARVVRDFEQSVFWSELLAQYKGF